MMSLVRTPRPSAVFAAALDFVLPKACVSCERPMDAGEPGVVCGRCWSRVRCLPHPQCDRCGHPHRAGTCRWCELLPPYVRAVRSWGWAPDSTAGHIIHALKYNGWRGAAAGMAERMGRLAWPRDVIEERSCVIPVPLHPARERARGFNQSELIAIALADRWHVPAWRDALVRERDTTTQTRLTPGERRRNVSGCFRASLGAETRLRGAHVVLVDDVVTTAATLNACAAALCAAGARIVSYVTFGRARASGDVP